MRRFLGLCLILSCFVATPALGQSKSAPSKLQITIDRARVDLDAHKLEVKLSHPADKVKMKVIGTSGAVLAELEKPWNGAAPGTTLVMTWTPSSAEAVAKIEVYGYDTDGFWAGIAVIPWKVAVQHDDVNFETASDVIRPSEVPKLEASFTKIQDEIRKAAAISADFGKISLFIIGHTDTVGTAESNMTLSRKRARAIAQWFKTKGVKAQITYEGVGESAPLVKTGDEVDEPKNRRADYILALEPPRLSSGGELAWKTL